MARACERAARAAREGSPLIATDSTSAADAEFGHNRLASFRIDLAIARALLVIALSVVAVYGAGVARHVPVYGPLDEFFHTAYVQKIADSGHPPVVGHDGLILGLGQKPPAPSDVVIRGLDHPLDPATGKHVTPVFPDGTTFPQNEAIQPPLYYVAMTPVALAVPWSQRVLVMRLLGTFFVMCAVLMLYLAVRVVSPHRPLAAGVAAAILGSMAGVISMLSQVQNDALLLPLCVASFWLLARDLRSRRSGLLLPFVGGLAGVTQIIAGPAGVIAVLVALAGDSRMRAAGWRSRAGLRLLAARAGIYALPILPWIVFNIWKYHYLYPIAITASGDAIPAQQNYGLLRHAIEYVPTAAATMFSGLWLQLWPLRGGQTPADVRPPAVIALVTAVALAFALCSGQAVRERLRLGFWAGAAIVSFGGVLTVLLVNAAAVGGRPDFVARYFVAFAAAYAGFVGTAVSCVGVDRAWLSRGIACGLSLVLIWQMLDIAYPWVVG